MISELLLGGFLTRLQSTLSGQPTQVTPVYTKEIATLCHASAVPACVVAIVL